MSQFAELRSAQAEEGPAEGLGSVGPQGDLNPELGQQGI